MTSTETKTSRFASIRLKLEERVSPLLAKVRPFFMQAVQFLHENPHLIRTVAVLPLIVTWFLALHSEQHRKAAYRGFLLSTIFLLSSWLVYWLIDTLRSFFGWGFVLQLVAFSLQGALSLLYIGYSIRLALAEYRRRDIANEPLDRLKDLLIETI